MPIDEFTLSDPAMNNPDPFQLAARVGGGAGSLGLPSLRETERRMALGAFQDPNFIRKQLEQQGRYVNPVDDPRFRLEAMQWAREDYDRARSINEVPWHTNPNEYFGLAAGRYRGDRTRQDEFLLRNFGASNISGNVMNQERFYPQALEYARQQIRDRQAAGLMGPLYGDTFALTAEPGERGTPFGYRQYTDEFGRTVLIGANGRPVFAQ